MATTLAVQTVTPRPGVAAEDVESLFGTKIFPTAADTPGSVNRANQSSIASQHLLRCGDGSEYLWVVRSSGVFGLDLFARVAMRMSEEAAPELDPVCERSTMRVVTQVVSYDQGPRDLHGPTGEPQRDVDL